MPRALTVTLRFDFWRNAIPVCTQTRLCQLTTAPADGNTALHHAARHTVAACVALLDASRVTQPQREELRDAVCAQQQNALHYAAASGRVAVLAYLLAQNGDATAQVGYFVGRPPADRRCLTAEQHRTVGADACGGRRPRVVRA